MQALTGDFLTDEGRLNHILGKGRNFDLIARRFLLGGRRASIWCIDGYADDGVLERMGQFWLEITPQQLQQAQTLQSFMERFVSFGESNVERRMEEIVTAVLLGKTALMVEGFCGCVLMDAKSYPVRGVEEPSDGRVLRGAHDGFVEVLVQNTALLRRRIRDPRLTLEGHRIGKSSGTDVVLAYMQGQADEELLNQLRQKLEGLDIRSFSMGQESVAEALLPGQWYNPFPRVRYTERPDKATASLLEGKILLLVDNSPVVMLLPTRLPDFLQDTNDYYFPPLVGGYQRLIRLVMLVLTVLITPVWYLLVTDPEIHRGALRFLAVQGEVHVPLLLQLFLVEFVVDILKLASLNTPNVLSNSFSMLGALILGDFAVQARWLVPEVLVYMAFVAIANFVQPSFELGYALKLWRMALLLLCAGLRWWGFWLGIAGGAALLLATKPLLGKHYLYPIVPFDGRELKRLLLRRSIDRDNT